jgi:type IV pilus assembly protein PilC
LLNFGGVYLFGETSPAEIYLFCIRDRIHNKFYDSEIGGRLMESSNSKSLMKSKLSRVGHGELSLFCYQMSIILKSGIQLADGLSMLAEEVSDKHFKRSLENMCKDIENGHTLYSSIDKQDVFPNYMKAMVMIGEKTGALDNIMDYLSRYFERNEKLSQKIRSAITYPLILTGLMAGIILLLILKVLPMFKDILDTVGGDMPLVTKGMLNISIGIKNYSFIILGVLLLFILLAYLFIHTSFGREFIDKWRVNLPLIRNITRKIYAARFSMVMSLLIKSGIDHDEALDMVKEVMGNKYVTHKIDECKKMISKGSDLKEAYAFIGIFPSLFSKMINIGYKTGEMDSMMAKISGIYENDVDNSLNKATSIIEPALVIILSVVVGIILMTVMLPLINIMSSIG